MKIYTGIDLHSNNSYLSIINKEGKLLYSKKQPNDLEVILEILAPYYDDIEGVVVESTYNWYWLVDGLKEAGYKVHLANTTANEQYSGKKHTDDKSDARWLADLLRLKLLSTGHIYPKEKRGIRELLRRRLFLVRKQTSCVLSIQGMLTRYENICLSGNKIKNEKPEKLLSLIKDEDVKVAAQSQIEILKCVMNRIAVLEDCIVKKIKKEKRFELLKGMPGIGPILAMTIMLETGDIRRFKAAGNYSSYYRCVESKRVSNAKKKGKNNTKNGNGYLCWAFIEAANRAIRSYPEVKKYYQRKLAKRMRVVALKAIANKLSKACYFVLRDEAEFDMKKLFVH